VRVQKLLCGELRSIAFPFWSGLVDIDNTKKNGQHQIICFNPIWEHNNIHQYPILDDRLKILTKPASSSPLASQGAEYRMSPSCQRDLPKRGASRRDQMDKNESKWMK
jgi:hypothetical protein